MFYYDNERQTSYCQRCGIEAYAHGEECHVRVTVDMCGLCHRPVECCEDGTRYAGQTCHQDCVVSFYESGEAYQAV